MVLHFSVLRPVLASIFVVAPSLIACDKLPFGLAEKGQTGANAELPSGSTQAAQRQAEEEAAEKARARAEEEAARKAQEEKIVREQAEEAVANCCQALSKAGFEERSMELMAATKVCEASRAEKKQLSEFRSELEAQLAGQPLPPACGPGEQ